MRSLKALFVTHNITVHLRKEEVISLIWANLSSFGFAYIQYASSGVDKLLLIIDFGIQFIIIFDKASAPEGQRGLLITCIIFLDFIVELFPFII